MVATGVCVLSRNPWYLLLLDPTDIGFFTNKFFGDLLSLTGVFKSPWLGSIRDLHHYVFSSFVIFACLIWGAYKFFRRAQMRFFKGNIAIGGGKTVKLRNLGVLLVPLLVYGMSLLAQLRNIAIGGWITNGEFRRMSYARRTCIGHPFFIYMRWYIANGYGTTRRSNHGR